MEAIEQKLKRKNAVLVANAIAKVVETIQQKNEVESGKEISELKFLKQKCGDSESLVSSSACQGIVALVEMGVVSVASAFSGFIAALTSAKNYSGIISAVGNLLVYDLEACLSENKVYICPFTIRNPQHPMITILKQRKDIWIDIFSQMKMVSSHESETISSNSVELFRPFILYILCAPSVVPSGYRLQTWDFLLKSQQNPNVDFLLDILSWLQIDSESELESAVTMYVQLCEFALNKKDRMLCGALSPTLASLAHQLVCSGHDPHLCLILLVQLLKVSSEPCSCTLVLLSETMAVCPAAYLKDLMKTCKCIVELKACNILSVKMLEYSILPWLVYPSYMTSEAVQQGSEILNLINELKAWSTHTGKLLANKYFEILRPVDSRVDAAAHICRMGEVWQGNSDLIEPWLEEVSLAPKPFAEKLQHVLSALLLHSFGDRGVQQTVMKLLLHMGEQQEELSGSLLTIILYKLANEPEPRVQLELLRALTQTAVLKENVTLILHTLESMRTRPSLQTLVIDLYLRLWKVELRCYPYLEKLLQEPPKDTDECWESDTAKAAVIKEMCESRPDLHSAELVSLLSKILTRCGDVSGSAASCLALQGITALCKAGIVDITTTWKALAPRMNRDKRPMVMKRWCEFMGAVPALRCPTQDYEKMVTEVLLRLWSYVVNSGDIEIINSAFSALANFQKDQLTLKGLPESFRNDLRLPSAYAKTPVDAARKPEDVLPYIPSECWIKMLNRIKPESLEAAGKMLYQWLSTEVEGIRSLPGRAEPSSYSHLPPHCVCGGLAHYLNRTYVPAEKLIVKECLRVLSNTLPKPLPPLNWLFLQQYLEVSDLQEHVITLASKQSPTSSSARKVLDDFISDLVPSSDTEDAVFYLYSNLGDVCKGIPPNTLRSFIEKSLLMALNQAVESGRNMEGEKFLKQLLSFIKAAFKKEDIHDANRTLLSQIIEGFLEKFDINSPYFNEYLECVVELPTKYIERMSSPSVWWEVTPEKLRLALAIRTAMARRADAEVPLVWLNECIDATANMSGEYTNVLKTIAPVFVNCRGQENNCPWTLELMGQIQNVINNKAESNQQAIVFLCDVFILAVVVLSGYSCLNVSLEGVSASRDTRLRLFPQSVTNLLSNEKWNKISSQMIEWLFYMQNTGVVSPLYVTAFRQALVSLHRDKQFKDNAVWLRFLDCKTPTAN